jgi:serine/threonine protein kinase
MNNSKNNRNKKSMKGVKILEMDGEIVIDTKILHEGNFFFRKMTNNIGEKEICKLLMKKHHGNIIKIYNIGENYIDMELLNTDMSKENKSEIKNVMIQVKTYLQSLGIIYIDWKLDNIGISDEGIFKLFDFDASGLIDIQTNDWIIRPPHWYKYKRSIENGMKKPLDIDNYAFNMEFTR